MTKLSLKGLNWTYFFGFVIFTGFGISDIARAPFALGAYHFVVAVGWLWCVFVISAHERSAQKVNGTDAARVIRRKAVYTTFMLLGIFEILGVVALQVAAQYFGEGLYVFDSVIRLMVAALIFWYASWYRAYTKKTSE